MGAHGWVVGVASHGCILLSNIIRSWLITVEAPGCIPEAHGPSTQLNAVVMFTKFETKKIFKLILLLKLSSQFIIILLLINIAFPGDTQ